MSDAIEPIRPAHPVLLYDDHCKFCRASAVFVETWDRAERLDFLPLSDPLAEQLLAPMSETQRLGSIHVVQPDGTVTSAGDALLAAFAELPMGAWVSDAAKTIPPIATGIKTLFRGLSNNRGSLAHVVPHQDSIRRWRGQAVEQPGV